MGAATKTIEFKINGMDCGHCVNLIEGAVRGLAGVREVKVSLADNNAIVRLDPERVSEEAIFDTVEDEGYDVVR